MAGEKDGEAFAARGERRNPCYHSGMKTKLIGSILILASLLVAACAPLAATPGVLSSLPPTASPTAETALPAGTDTPAVLPSPSAAMATATPAGPAVTVLADNLEIPWEVAFLDDGSVLLTERNGNLVLLAPGQAAQRIPVAGVNPLGEGGLLGLALDPAFSSNHTLYLYLTSSENGQAVNRVERYTFQNGALAEGTVILQGIAGAGNHDGGRIAFGPDGLLYITTGDAGNSQSAQDLNSLNGKILRIQSDGSIPADNPFGTAVYSYGHRNPEGLTWDDQGRLWETEHGPSGAGSGYDEINLIEPGKNYGWPVIQGDETQEGMISPVLQSGGDETWAPSGVQFLGGYLYFSGLRGTTLYRAKINGDRLEELTRFLVGEYGRLRAVRLGPDGALYLTTSNRDGRGLAGQGDDKLLRVEVSLLSNP